MVSGYYDITGKTLGKGHYGVVKLARHCLTGEPVAIKIIEKAKLNNDSLNQLGTEIRILFRLSEYEHPNILKLYQTIDTEAKLYLITEYCGPHACDLHDYLLRKHCRNGLSEREAQVFFIQICSAISYCHSMGIVHRDLKPENILVTDYRHTHESKYEKNTPKTYLHEYPLLKLIDFGFSNQWNADEKMRTSCGTLAYSAPELLLGEPYDGTKVDVWGLGLMLYILLYGGNPFMQINDNETLTKILDCSFTTPARDNVAKDAIELLRSLIKRNPDSRLQIEAIMLHKWFATLPEHFELLRNYQLKALDRTNSRQLPKTHPIVSPTLPSISETLPLRNSTANRSMDDDQMFRESNEKKTPDCNRTRSLSITRTHLKTAPQQQQSLSHSNSIVNVEKASQNSLNLSPLPRGPSMYRPTSPDVGGLMNLSEEEKQIHESVIAEMFQIPKYINTKSSIEASLKRARLSHRLFNQSSIQKTQFASQKRKGITSIVESLVSVKSHFNSSSTDESSINKMTRGDKKEGYADKLSNDDYIYATYQLTRDKILRVSQDPIGKFRLAPDDARNDKADSASKKPDFVMAYALPLARKCSLVSEEEPSS